MKLVIYQDPTPIYQTASLTATVLYTALAGEHLDVLEESDKWPKVSHNGIIGYVSHTAENHFVLENDIYELVATDAKIYLKDVEEVEFVDGVVSPVGPFALDRDYKLGDIVGLHITNSNLIIPVVIVELANILEGNILRIIPTFQKFAERT